MLKGIGRAGDREFFAEFCRDYQRAIWLAARQVLGAAREELAYDATQQTLCKLARQAAKLRQMTDRQRGAYAYQAARRNALNLLAAEARHEHTRLPEQAAANPGDEPERRLLAKEQGERLAAAVASLPEIYREALLFCVIDCMSSREAAAELGISESNLRQRKRRGLALLRELLREDMQDIAEENIKENSQDNIKENSTDNTNKKGVGHDEQ